MAASGAFGDGLIARRSAGGGSRRRFRLEPPGAGGGNRCGVVRGLFGMACDEAVAALVVVPDASLPDELVEDGADGLVAGCGM